MRASIDSTDSPEPGTGRTFRTTGALRFAGAYGLIGAIVLIILGASAQGAHAADGRVVSYVGAGLIIVFSIRAFTLGVYVIKDRVRIRNMLITRWVRLSDVEKFSYGPLRVFPAVGIATLSDGRKLAMTGIAVGRGARKRARANAVSLITELNQVLEEHRASASPGK